ncbi:MAG: copper amine oxidase N-terminal domain-containing protein [Clostridiales bacterium]|jgi:hypothetical protein|nr:copper amine oxidase N-terminal domain-containing protein [Clostridiales bacterium]
MPKFFKITILFIAYLFMFSLQLGASSADSSNGKIKITVNNKLIKSDAEPFIDSEGRTMVPLRFISEALGCRVEWYGDLRMAAIDTPNKDTLIFEAGTNKYYLNYGKASIMDTKTVVVSGRAYVPLRLIAEKLEFNINWDNKTKTINLTK